MPPQTAQSGSLISGILPFVLVIGIFYFMVIRPQKAEQKKHQQMLEALGKNDEVVTSGGVHGTVVAVKDKVVTLRVDENVKIDVEKNCVARVVKKQSANQGN
ncbi:MAG: preprotein translocase subunit YajC [Candidatus Omnitrophica bacterium]|jgi:preprotein translocase subunit YajC|nr:preprotein translocase subunit YajC [Candidatus Omnitrophota bacterium]MDD5078882.1 preprotein translocase subunit YajC [Candidatus Omnitrophota bacterium]